MKIRIRVPGQEHPALSVQDLFSAKSCLNYRLFELVLDSDADGGAVSRWSVRMVFS